ncbi:unnamed protein product [Amoebophrya sp. A120]|nr:unnamed protein product [Amoebophrya sp. A120]|eukprot:GSA120T00018367001.1
MSATQKKVEKKSASGYGIAMRGSVGALAAVADIGNILGASAYDQSKPEGGGGGFTLTPEGETEDTDVSTADAVHGASTSAAASALQARPAVTGPDGYWCEYKAATGKCVLVAPPEKLPEDTPTAGFSGIVVERWGGLEAAAACCTGPDANPRCEWKSDASDGTCASYMSWTVGQVNRWSNQYWRGYSGR